MATAESKAGQRGPSNQQLAKLIEDQKRSGLSVAVFAKKHGIPVWKFYQAGRTRRKRRSDFAEITVSSDEPGASPLELVLPGNLRVCIPPGFDEPTLRRLLGALC
jgi:hypothetical protein